ncbi:hypothetical protein JHK87_040378 [Glycine soja]|nr:hypothetical protein JHK87_040378 [Glycine soja]
MEFSPRAKENEKTYVVEERGEHGLGIAWRGKQHCKWVVLRSAFGSSAASSYLQLSAEAILTVDGISNGPLSTSPNQLDGDKITGATNHKSVNLEGSLLVQHLFKDHRRCSYMIANALDKDGKFTTAQVSQKLKQLGLYLPLPKDGKFTTAQGVLLLN